eukprot:767561-Hanusia_phi.AAC.4
MDADCKAAALMPWNPSVLVPAVGAAPSQTATRQQDSESLGLTRSLLPCLPITSILSSADRAALTCQRSDKPPGRSQADENEIGHLDLRRSRLERLGADEHDGLSAGSRRSREGGWTPFLPVVYHGGPAAVSFALILELLELEPSDQMLGGEQSRGQQVRAQHRDGSLRSQHLEARVRPGSTRAAGSSGRGLRSSRRSPSTPGLHQSFTLSATHPAPDAPALKFQARRCPSPNPRSLAHAACGLAASGCNTSCELELLPSPCSSPRPLSSLPPPSLPLQNQEDGEEHGEREREESVGTGRRREEKLTTEEEGEAANSRSGREGVEEEMERGKDRRENGREKKENVHMYGGFVLRRSDSSSTIQSAATGVERERMELDPPDLAAEI